jgi:multidrug resistance efflux pump
MFRKLFLPAIGAALFIFAVYHVVRAQQVAPKADPVVEPARSPYRGTIAGSGMVEPETENIAIGSHNPGVVDKVFVKVGDRVEKGKTPLFRLDDRMLNAEIATRTANLKAAQAQLERLQSMPRPEEVPPAEARVREAKANLIDAEDQYDRIAKLANSPSILESELVKRKQAMEVAREQLRQAEANLKLLKAGAWQADIAVAETAVAQADRLLKQSQTELERLEVRASVDGEVLQVNVRPGEYVGAPPNQALIMLGGTRKHVRVDIDENDLARFRSGLPAKARRRGEPGREIPLRFVRVEPFVIPKKSLTGGTQERVDTRVLQVIYAVGESNAPLYVGQQLDVFLGVEN